MGVRLIAKNKIWILCCGLVFISVVLPFAAPEVHLSTIVGDLVQCSLLGLVLVSFLLNTRQTEPRPRLFWILMSLGSGLWLLAQILWTYFEVFLGKEVPNPFVGDVIIFLHLVPMMAALALRPEVEQGERDSSIQSLDFALMMIWWLYLYLFVVIPWQYVAPNAAVYGRSFDLIYLLEHFVFLACVNAAWLRGHGKWKLLYGHLLGAASIYAMGSMAASFAIDLGQYHTGGIYDIPLAIAMAWFASVGLLAKKMRCHTEVSHAVEREKKGWFAALGMLAILSLPVLTAWALYLSHTPSAVREFRVNLSLGAMMVMATLIWIKQRRLDRQVVRANQELREDALTDTLTHARNRRFFNGTIAADVQQAIRSYLGPENSRNKRNQDLVFYLIDADDFKTVNDRHGHDIGDALLVEIARRISSAIRHSDVLIRWGGDEFLVLSRYTDRSESGSLASRVLSAISSEPIVLESGLSVRSTCSVGWAAFPWFRGEPERIAYEEVLKLADAALYEAKKAGRNQAVGMLSATEAPARGSDPNDLRSRRRNEYLGAEMITIPGPGIDLRRTATPGMMAATERS